MKTPFNETAQFLTVEQVAELLAVCRLTVYRLIKSGRLIAYRVGKGAYRIERADFQTFLAGCRSDQQPQAPQKG